MREAKKRYIYLDILRIISCLMVIFNHTDARGFLKFVLFRGVSYSFYFTCSTLCKSAVPIFFAISGALLIKKDETILKTYKRLPKILIDIIIFTMMYYFIDSILYGYPFSFSNTINDIFTRPFHHLWFLYAYAAFIIFLPILRKLVQGLNKKNSIYLISITFLIMGFMPIICTFYKNFTGVIFPWKTTNVFIYPILGYILDSIIDIKKIDYKNIILLWIFTIISIVISGICEVNYLKMQPKNIFSENFLVNFSILHVITIFITIKYLTFVKEKSYSKLFIRFINELSICTFGIYVFHLLFINRFEFFINFCLIFEQGLIGRYVGILFSCLLIFAICGIITYVLRKIPLIRKLL